MQLGDQDVERLTREGTQLLQQGRAAEARGRFQAAAGTGRGGAQVWLLLAIACRAQTDRAAEEEALDRLLAIEPQAVRGLIMKADCRLGAGDERAAVYLYKNALRLAEGQSLPPADVAELRRAEEVARRLDASFAATLEDSLAARGFPPEGRSPRFQQSLDIMG